MTFTEMLPALQSQASRVFNGNKDSMQDALGMAYANYNSCLNRKNRQLSIGELTNFIKYRATELNNGIRPHFGNISKKRTNDVYYKPLYLDGKVERLYFEHEDADFIEGDHGFLAYQTRVPSCENDILFNIDFGKFRKQLNCIDRELLDLLVVGYNPTEISRVMLFSYGVVKDRLTAIGQKYDEFFQCRDVVVA
ncbi:MAG: hypothetical protein J7K40_04195 [candidate division Zixibacteria bacterium]|nr:hypothetical protein [candidate division Zixibacteria bacterium]